MRQFATISHSFLHYPLLCISMGLGLAASTGGCIADTDEPQGDAVSNADATAPGSDTAETGNDTTTPPEDVAPPDDTTGLDADETIGDDATTAEPVSWHAHVRPLVERHCSSCHAEGAVGGFAMDDYDAITGLRPLMVGRVLSGEMPPWPMDPDCRQVQDHRHLSAEQRAVFAAWREGGYQRGNPLDYVAPAPREGVDAGPADVLLTRAEAYVADRELGDDYRCFVQDFEVESEMWVTGANVLPDVESIVHHVLVYVVPPTRVAGVLQRDANAAGLGYPCLGGVGARGDEALLAGWVPGMQPMHFPPGAAFRVEAGSRFVVQMHYNTLYVPANEAVPADATAIELWTLEAGATPQKQVHIQPIADGDLNIQPGVERVVEGISFTSPASATVIGVIPHMHLLGTEISVRLTRGLTGEEVCLANIPKWDFHWQQVYQYEVDDHVPMFFGDTIHLSCIYDNSAANQPVVNGVRQEPRNVSWGEGTLDEMCLNYLVTTVPWVGDDPGQCPGASACIHACPEGDALCPVQCFGLAGNDCVSCAVAPLYDACGREHCLGTLIGLGICLDSCTLGDNLLGCAATECRPELDAHYGCLEEPMRAGLCDVHLDKCDVKLGSD